MTSVLTRHPGNPIVTAAAVPRANSIHNSAVVKRGDGDYAGVFRVDELDLRFTLHGGRSRDGVAWEIDPDPLQLDTGVAYDPRLTLLDGTYLLTWCIHSGRGPAIGLAATTDFESFTRLENPLPPANRNCVVFPRRVGGKVAIYHRPSDRGHTPFGDIYYAESPDLVHWGRHRYVFGPCGGWQSLKVGPGPHPIETPEGWLLLYHGVWQSCNGYLYYAGGALLDLEEPWRVRYRTRDYLLAPTELYERVGDVPNVCFPSAAVVEDGRLRLYYGCADTCIGLAEGDLAEVVAFVKEHSFEPDQLRRQARGPGAVRGAGPSPVR